MTEPSHEVRVETYLVVAFDMRSSSNMIEDLTLTGNIRRLRDFMISIKKWLKNQSEERGFTVYKFTGDGWILLFPSSTEGQVLVDFLRDLSRFFDRSIKKRILPYLEERPKAIGLTFGIEKGPLVRMVMMNRTEFLGRPLNIACRLQSAAGRAAPEYPALASNQVHTEYLKKASGIKTVHVRRALRNIRGGASYRCVKLKLIYPKR